MEQLTLFHIYLLNLAVTVGMFAVLVFRAWIELKNLRLLWRELEWRKISGVAAKVLKTEKDLFLRVRGGEELHRILCEIFGVSEE